MNLYSIPPLVGSLLALGIAILVLANDIRSKVNIIFALFSFSLFGWLFSFTIAYSNKNAHVAYLWGKVGCNSVDFAGPLLYHFIAIFLRKKKELKWVYATYILAAIIVTLSLTTNYVFATQPHKYYWGYYPNAGPLHILAISLHSLIMLRILMLLYNFMKRKAMPENYYRQIQYIFWGIIILVFPGLTDYLPKYGIEVYPFGWAFVIIFCGLVAYAIIKHKLMDINIVFRSTLVYSILVGLMTAIFVVMILLLEKFFQGFAGYRSLLASTLSAFIIALTFNPAKNKIQILVDRYFWKGTPQEILNENILLHQELLKQDRMKAVATLAASMAHEIKNPLTVIKTYTDFLPEKHSDENFVNSFMRLVKPQVEKINFTIQQLLDFSKPVQPDLKPANIFKILSETLELLSSDFLNKKIKTEIQPPDNEAIVSADASQLKQVFLNLFLNAIEAMPRGGRLIVTGKMVNDNLVEIGVEDTGEGISKENLGRIFQPFFTTKPTGTGLGLSVVRDILNLHKATIRIESEKSRGTTFVIKFPLINRGKE